MRPPLKRKITAILAADIAEYTRITAEDEEETLARLESYRLVFDDFVVRAGGRVFNSAGDSVMCEFPSAVEATRCAIDIQESLRTRNMAFPADRQMHFRIGISIGDVVERDGDLLGDGVNIAARLQTMAEPGAICVSRNVQEAVANKISLPFVDLGHRAVKNLPYPVHAFQIAVKDGSRGPAPPLPGAPSRWQARSLWVRSLGIVALITLIAGGFALFRWSSPERSTAPPVASMSRDPLERTQNPALESIIVTENLTPAQAFEKLSKSGGLVKDATRAAEHYHNARVQEARGEHAAARQSYLALAALGSEHIDPLLRLAALLRAQDGRAGAREVLAELAQRAGRSARLVHNLQFEGAERLKRLTDFAQANPDFAPAHYMLAVELGEDRQNTQTIDEKRRERAALELFLAAERAGKLAPFFLDQSVMSAWIEHAQKREVVTQAFFADGRDRISVAFTPTNAGWLGAIALPEPALHLEYRLGSNTEFRSTGVEQVHDSRTGKPMPRHSISFPAHSPPTEIMLRYTDAKGLASPVTTIAFDPKTALHLGLRRQLEVMSSSWLSFGTSRNTPHVYLTMLLAYRCAIEKVEIGFNGQAPQEVVSLPVCDFLNPMQIPADAPFTLALKPATETVTIRLTFIGGDQSDVKTFPRPANR